MNRFSILFVLVIFFSPFTVAQSTGKITGTECNPAISLILNGGYVDRDEGELDLPGFQLGGEAALPQQGFSTGHNELSLSSNIDDKFYGAVAIAIVSEEGETAIELETAYVETLGLGNGLVLKGGRFYSGIGYLNGIHDHAHDFSDRPLVYDALFGGHLADTGVQVTWLAPTDVYINFGLELRRGNTYPSGENVDGNKGLAIFVKTGADINVSSSWQLGASFYQSEFDVREAGGHLHGGEAAEADNELLNGEVDIAGIDFVYKWAPNGNVKNKNFKLQAEYFVRNEEGVAEFTEGTNGAEATYQGEQSGAYIQGVYQFRPMWRVGVRFDQLEANNEIASFINNGIDEEEFLKESGIGAEDNPTKNSVMLD